MEFRFDIHQLCRSPIVKINNSLVPSGFIGEHRRSALEATQKVAEIITDVGEASARAQGLSRAVTTSQKLRNSDHVIYLLTEPNGKNGLVVGMLKVGHKSLYVFDNNGETQNVVAPCVLDFYVHESRQRAGLGRQLFDHMLEHENISPNQMAIDRPSEKLLGFLRKHYGLTKKIPQMNNFVVYEGFFANMQRNEHDRSDRRMHIAASPNNNLFGADLSNANDNQRSSSLTRNNVISPCVLQMGPVGRYAAPKPTCSMAQIIHQKSGNVGRPEPNSFNNDFGFNTEYLENGSQNTPSEQVDDAAADAEVELELANLNISSPAEEDEPPKAETPPMVTFADDLDEAATEVGSMAGNEPVVVAAVRPTTFQHSKQHTGLKNMSTGVNWCVTPTTKMEFDQEANDGFGSVKINRPIGVKAQLSPGDTESIDSRMSNGSNKTDQGHVDLKFYHNRLW